MLYRHGRYSLIFQLIATLRKHQFEGIRIDERSCYEHKDKQQEHQVRHCR